MSSDYTNNRNTNSHLRGEHWTLRPKLQLQTQTQETFSSPSPPPEPSSSSHQNNPKRPQFAKLPRPNWSVKSRFVKNSEKEKEDDDDDESSVGGSGSNDGHCETGQEDSEGLRWTRISVDEPELPEELLAINQQLQEDELLAMDSIYGDSIIILDNQCGLKCFQVNIHVEATMGLCITTEVDSSDFHDDVSDSSYSLQVEYLPPIVLTCLLPKSYPSKSPPYFTISAQWLGSTKISDLCCKLDSIWLEQAGQEVMYQWVEWLQNCTLSYLGFDNVIVLGPYGVRHDEDSRAISGSVSPDIDIPLMKSYNDDKRCEIFYRNIQQCRICLSEFPGSEFSRLPCQHFFCTKCLKTFTDIHIKDGSVYKIKCPEAKCDGVLPPSLLKTLLGEEELEDWESLILQKTLETMTDVVNCPRCDTASLEDKDDHAQCSMCYYSFCTLCRNQRHVGVVCMTQEKKLSILQGRQSSTSLKSDQKRREQNIIDQILNLREISCFTKQCPNCKMAIARVDGCNSMVCKNCGTNFCYRCNEAISGQNHFSGGSCNQFPEPNERAQRWKERSDQVGAQIAVMFPGHVHPCPKCGKKNVKAGKNNNILCWACQNHFCRLCLKIVKRCSEHFGPNGCRQHTVG